MAWEPLAGDDPAEVAGYRLRGRLGAGGMGRVYLAFTPGGRPVAVKVIRPELGDDAEFRARFRREIAAARRVSGLFTAQVLDGDPDGSPPWLVTAYVAGPSLAQAVAEHGPMPPASVLRLMAGVAEALAAIHAAGVVHRDLKPSNVLLASDGPRVIDFGIARAAEGTSVTRTGMRAGSPPYMAPEQVRGGAVTPAGDVFALGALACYAATGRPPFGQGDEAAVLFRVLHQDPDLDGCPAPLRQVIEWCLAKDPAARPAPARLVEFCRDQAAGPAAGFGGSWLPPDLAADLARHAVPTQVPPMPAAPAWPSAVPAQAPPGTGPTRRRTLVQAGGPPRPRRGPRPALIAVVAAVALVAGAASYALLALSPGGGRDRPADALDSCLFGTWTGTAVSFPFTADHLHLTMTGRGPVMIFRSDGVNVIDYGSGSTLTVRVDGVTWTEVFAGSITSRYTTRNATLSASSVSTRASYTILDNRRYYASGPVTPSMVKTEAERYTCSATTLRLTLPGGAWQEMARGAPPASPAG
jgi:Protein kinase domain